MLLAIDIGNTNTVFALFEKGNLQGTWRFETQVNRTADEIAAWFFQLLTLKKQPFPKVEGAIVSSVVPQILPAIQHFCRDYMQCEPLILGRDALDPGIRVELPNPEEVGSDRLVNALAAWRKYSSDLIILDFGTATTFDVISYEGCYLGGVIAPGINLSLDALHRATAKLPNVTVAKPGRVIGRHTVEAMQSGVYYGYLGLIDGIITRIKDEYNRPMRVVATGGLAPLFATAAPYIDDVDLDLTIDGLLALYQLNTAAKAVA